MPFPAVLTRVCHHSPEDPHFGKRFWQDPKGTQAVSGGCPARLESLPVGKEGASAVIVPTKARKGFGG